MVHFWQEKENVWEEEIEELKLEIDKLKSLAEQIRKKRKSNYESDLPVVPYSMAATSRVKKLQYKEIQTPSWKEVDETTGSTCTTSTLAGQKVAAGKSDAGNEPAEDDDFEDISDMAFKLMHSKREE